MKLISIMLLVSGMLAGGQIMLKTGLNKAGGLALSGGDLFGQLISIFTNGWVLGGIAMIGSQMLLWFWVLANFDLSRAYPLISMSYIFALILSMVILKENPGATRIIGTVLIIAGVALVAKV